MKSTFTIKRTNVFNIAIVAPEWNRANKIKIDNWPWHKEGYSTPKVTVKALYSKTHLYLNYHIIENYIRAQYTEYQDPVCQDSCVEFFVSADNMEYLNFEVNAIGSLLLNIGNNRFLRKKVCKDDAKKIKIVTTLPYKKAIPINRKCIETGYSVAFSIPLKLFSKLFKVDTPVKGVEWLGNFYKCGDKTKEPSWGCWNPVQTENPDFHRPEFFGKLVFE